MLCPAYSGTAVRIENCQIGVFLSYASQRGRTLIDRELYVPQEWFTDKKRCQEAGISEEVTFKTKPTLAKQMLQRAFDNGIKPAWVVGDEVYGCASLRTWQTVYCQFRRWKLQGLFIRLHDHVRGRLRTL